jgi:hypothetical protein
LRFSFNGKFLQSLPSLQYQHRPYIAMLAFQRTYLNRREFKPEFPIAQVLQFKTSPILYYFFSRTY